MHVNLHACIHAHSDKQFWVREREIESESSCVPTLVYCSPPPHGASSSVPTLLHSSKTMFSEPPLTSPRGYVPRSARMLLPYLSLVCTNSVDAIPALMSSKLPYTYVFDGSRLSVLICSR